MTSRILVLSVLDPGGQTGMEPAVSAANELGATVIPVTTGILTGTDGAAPRLRATRARTLETALRDALDGPLDGMLIELIPSYWQARVVEKVLRNSLPETLVFAPLAYPGNRQWLAPRNWALQAHAIVPEATTVVLPEDDGAALALGNKDAEPIVLARWALDLGAHSAWVLGKGSYARGIDLVAHGADSGVLDYPLPPNVDGQAPRSLPAALAALLASGLPLTEAIAGAHRFARNPGNPIFSVAGR